MPYSLFIKYLTTLGMPTLKSKKFIYNLSTTISHITSQVHRFQSKHDLISQIIATGSKLRLKLTNVNNY